MNPNPPNPPTNPQPITPPSGAPWMAPRPNMPPVPPMPRPKQSNPIAAAWNSSPGAKVAMTVAAVLICLMAICSCCGIGTAIVGSAQPSSPAQPGGQYHAPRTSAPTATPKATATPAKPTPTLSPAQQQAQQLAKAQADLQAIVKANTDAKVETVAVYSDGSAEVNINVGEQFNEGTAADTCKMDAFQLLQAIYTGWHSRPAKFVTVWLYVRGPTIDKYGKSNPDDVYAAVSLTPQTAAKIEWQNLEPGTAWAAYDIAIFAPWLQAN